MKITLYIQWTFNLPNQTLHYLLKLASILLYIYIYTYILIYVDLVITGNNTEEINSIVKELDKKFPVKDLGQLNYFLGKEVNTRSSIEIVLSKRKYIAELQEKTQMSDAKGQRTPMINSQHYSKHRGEPMYNIKQYRSVGGALQYATITKPDIVFSVNKVRQFMQAPLDNHRIAVKRIIRYLKATVNYGLHIKASSNFNII